MQKFLKNFFFLGSIINIKATIIKKKDSCINKKQKIILKMETLEKELIEINKINPVKLNNKYKLMIQVRLEEIKQEYESLLKQYNEKNK